MADCVDTEVSSVQEAAPDPPRDTAIAQPEPAELIPRHDPVLLRRKPGDRLIEKG
jgi:hypothetical protein